MTTLLPQRPPTLAEALEIVSSGILQGRRAGRRPRLHPNGFIQYDLDAACTARLHVWPAVPLQAQKTRHPIHDHVFDMQSTILAGRLRNVLYKALPLDDFAAECAQFETYRMYRATRITKDDTVLAPADEKLYAVVSTVSEDCEPGDTYSMQQGVLHDSVPDGLTCTLMYKLSTYTEYRPVVAVPASVKPDNDYRRETTNENELWRHIYLALELASANAAQRKAA